MTRGGRGKYRNDGFYTPARGPAPPLGFRPPPPPPPRPPGWHGPPFPGGHSGYDNPDVGLMDDSIGFRPMMEPDYAPMDETGFGPMDPEFRRHGNRLHGPRPMMDYGPIPDMEHGPVTIREYDHFDPRDRGPVPGRPMIPEPPEFRPFAPSYEERDFGSTERQCALTMDRGFGPMGDELGPLGQNYPPAMDERGFGSAAMPMEGGFGSMGDSSSVRCQDQRGMFFPGPRAFHGPPDLDGEMMMGCPKWTDTSGMPPPGHHHDNQMNPMLPGPPMPGPPIPEPPAAVALDPSASKKPKAPKKPKIPPKLCAKPPPGRFQGIISFVGTDYGFIERDDMKKIHFSFESFWGDTSQMIPGVRVQFTVYKDKEKGKECATDVVVPSGGTEEVDGEILVGAVIKSESQASLKTRKLTLPKLTGCIQATLLDNETADLPFTTHDYRPTLLKGDQVQFNLLTDLVTKERRATNIALMPNTFQFTDEKRETGVVMYTKDGSGSVMSEEWSNLCFDADENLNENELRVMDEVEFTVISLKGKEQQRAVRVKKLPEGTVTFGKKTRERIAEAMEKNSTRFTMEKGKWKAVTSEVLPQRTVVFEDVGSEQYEGTIVTTPASTSDKTPEKAEALPGLLVASVAGVDRNLPFGSSDVVSEATMMPGDRVQFNICTKRSTKAERATNVEMLLDRLNHSLEQREKGVVMDLRESFGFIRCQQDPQLFFHLKEVLEESKLNLMDEVEFTVVPASTGEGNQAVRVKKLLCSAFTAVPKLEGLGAPSKEKKKITIKLLRDSVNEEMKNLKVKIESYSPESATDEDPAEPLDENCNLGEQEVGDSITPKSENDSHPVKMDKEGDGMEVEGKEKSSSSVDTLKQAKETVEAQSGGHGGSSENDQACRAGKYRSPTKQHSRRRSRSHSSERSRQYEHRYRRSRSRSRDRSGWSGRRRSRSKERADSHSRRRSRSKERADSHSRRRSHSKERADAHSKRRSRSKERADSHSRRRSRSKERADAHSKRRSRSKERADSHSRRRSRSKERADAHSRRRSRSKERTDSYSRTHSSRDSASWGRKRSKSRSPKRDSSSRKKVGASDDKNGSVTKDRSKEPLPKAYPNPITQELPRSENILDVELSKKKRELELLEEHIARKRAIIAMEQKGLVPKGQSKYELDSLEPKSTDKPAPLPVKSILKKRTEPYTDFSQQSEISKNILHKVSQSHFGSSPVDQPPFLQITDEQSCFDLPPDQPPLSRSVSQREPVRQSAVHQPPFNRPPVCYSPPFQQAPAKSTASSQFERFLRTLNKGVDAELLTSVIKGVKEETLTHETVESCMPPQREVLYKDADQYKDSHRRTTEEPDDFLLPHERACQDGSGFSRILGLKHGLPVEVETWREGDVDDEERFLYGETDEGECGSAPVEVDKRPWEPSQREEPQPSQDKLPHFDKIQSLLQTIGLDLDISEVSKLTDRTQERLYGKKQKAKLPGQVDCGSSQSTGRSGRHRSQTDSPESDRTRSISPVRTSHREVYMTHQGALEHSGVHDKEKLATIVRMVRSLQKSNSPTHSTPSSSSTYSLATEYKNTPEHERTYRQHGIDTVKEWNQPLPGVQSPPAYPQHPGPYADPQHSGAYADPQHSGAYTDPQHPRAYTDPQHPGAYADPQHPGSYANPQHPGPYTDPQHPGSYANPQHPGSYANPQHPGSYANPQRPGSYVEPPSTFVNVPVGSHVVPSFLSTHSLPQLPLPSPVGLPPGVPSPFVSPPPIPLPSFFEQPPQTFTGAASYYARHPLTGVPIMPMGGAAFPVPQPVVVEEEVENSTWELATTKSRCLTVIKTVQLTGKKATTNLKVVTTTSKSSSDSTLPPSSSPSESAEKKQVTTISEDDIKAKQKKRLEQFNERMRQKKEQQREAMKSRVESQKVPPGKTCTEVKNVWVCGHSLVFWAEKRAKSPEYGMQLGMDPSRVRVWWKGMQGMTWEQLLPQLLKLKGSWPNPDVLILHLGGNDLGKSDPKALLAAMRKDLASLQGIFPNCLLVWSDILPRRSWRAAEDCEAVERYRALVNRRVAAIIAELGGAVVSHDSIRPGSDAGLYRPDGVHLSGKGIDMFNIDLQDFLEKWEGEES